MFTWICPQCGREVPPSYTECPDCAARAKTPAAPPAGEPAQEAATHPAPAPPLPQPVVQAAPAPQPSTPTSGHLPGWLLTIVFTLAFVGLAASVYWGVNYFRGAGANSGAAAAPAVVMENPATRTPAKPHPLAKHLEVAGVRWVGDKNKTEARFLLINHSEAEITNLVINLRVWGRTQRSEEEPVGAIDFKIADIGPNESKEVTALLASKLKIYELPDWQNVTTEMQIVSPPAQ